MSHLLESLKIENRQLHHVNLHNRRFNEARKMLFNKQDFIFLENLIELPEKISNSRYKCRVVTNGNSITYEIKPYTQRKIESLKVVHMNDIDYTFKTDDRSKLDEAFNQRGDSDDIIIVKNGMVTDAWAANLILFDGEKWLTPTTPLLKGTQREYLLSKGKISEKNIQINELHRYKSIKLINAMIGMEVANEIEVKSCVIF